MGEYKDKSDQIKNETTKHINNLVKFTQKDHLKHFQKVDRHIVEHDQRAAQSFKSIEKKLKWILVLLSAIVLTNIIKEIL
jgi:hypothetical protein